MSPDERMDWLRDRGIQIETAEERKEKAAAVPGPKANQQQNDDEEQLSVMYVYIPHDTSLPMQELKVTISKSNLLRGDVLPTFLQPAFSKKSGEGIDLNLLEEQALTQFGSSDSLNVSSSAMEQVAQAGSVETFRLVPPVESNRYTNVNIYLDEVGLLKRLPLNTRAAKLALQCGFNPSPKIYGNVFVGRLANRPFQRNVDFGLKDVANDADWIQKAVMENLKHQTEMNQMTGRSGDTQAAADGEDGVAKDEVGYSWTQNDEELEIIVQVDSSTGDDGVVSSRDIKVLFLPKRVVLKYKGGEVVSIDLYASIDPDGCTWTLEKKKNVVLSCEKGECTSWPRIHS